jgi:penicillin-binding protein 2
VTDVDTGEVLALVSYPSYDNNKITVDSSYLNELNNDLSSPLYSRATQTKVAPGSIFKMVTSFAGMEEDVLEPWEKITTASNGTFNKSNITVKCHIAPGNHGTLGISGALEKSCNYFFCEVGYRLSLTSSGNYSATKGLSAIQKYSALFGFDQKSGIEISEASPHITEEDPVQSSIGQGSHAYTNTQMNRYVTTIANGGQVLDLNLVKKSQILRVKLLKSIKRM